MVITKRFRYLTDRQVSDLFRIVFTHSFTSLGSNDMWDAYNIGLISDSALQNAACYHLMRAIVETRPNTPYCALVAEVAKATFSIESRVRNLMCVDYYGTPIQDLRKSLKLK
jgi:hypothetical protein